MKTSISYDDFAKLDFRAGKVVKAEAPEWSNKLLRLEVDFGQEIGSRVIFSGISKWYQPEELTGKLYVFLINMEYKKMGEEESQGMMIMADGAEKPILLNFIQPVKPGEVVR
ncbi:methionine--tRNA ligase [Candidatus Collierbacteria bacterium]|nr:methionine--tRNA ligase [Candidatus Collierbacteria bacterium]